MDNNKTISNGCIHVHSENSLFDSALKISRLCEVAFEHGAPAIALTDHGTLTGVDEFMDAVKDINSVIDCCREKNCGKCKYGTQGPENCTHRHAAERYITSGIVFKGIPGVEVYYEEDDNLTRRAHLLLLPMDYSGYKAIAKAVTLSNHRIDEQGMPRVNVNILMQCFGKGAEGHNHVIATSACMNGIIASILLSNDDLQKSIKKLERKQVKHDNPNSKQYAQKAEERERLSEQIAELTIEIKNLTAISKKPYAKKERALKSIMGTPEYDERRAALDAEKAETERAKASLAECKKAMLTLKSRYKAVSEYCKNSEQHHEKWRSLQQQINELRSAMVSEAVLRDRAVSHAKAFVEIFGDGNFYAELQYHRIPEEKQVMPIVAEIADQLGLPLVAANDAHMAGNSDDELKARQIMRSLRYNKWEDMSESDRELYIKTDAALSAILSEILPEGTVKRAMEGIGSVVSRCDVKFNTSSHYPKYTPEIEGETSEDCLRRKCYDGIEWRFPNREGWTEEYQKRLDYEINVICKMGYADYHLIVQDFLEYGRLLGKLDLGNPPQEYIDDPYNKQRLGELTKDSIGVGIGVGRGSAVGSLACYLLGITGVDPIKYELIFERFLNVERVSMPDIDSDFRPDIRNRVLDYVKHKYGEKAVCCIMTRNTQQAKAAIRNCARLLGSEIYGDTKAFLSLGDDIAKAVPNELGIKLDECVDVLQNKFANDKHAMTIIQNARLVEGVFTHVGMHAAGVIISDNGDVSDYVPLLYVSGTKQFATQCDMGQCESKGLLKMDFLGLRNLGIINSCIELINSRYGIKIDVEKLPFEADVFREIFSAGNTNSVFQFESSGMKQMLRQFKPESIEDVILLVAAYRPGPLQYLDSIIAVKHGKKKAEYVVPEMEVVLGKTYGSPIYQEQILQIFNKFAGFSLGEADVIRRYMSKKKTDKFMAYKDKFVDGMVKSGAEKSKAEAFWEQLVEFSKYAFNRSHAAAYAFTAYYTAWLKCRYPKEYLCAVMNDTEFDKLNGLIGDCRAFGITVSAVSINESQEKFTVNDSGVLYGLGNIKNVGNAAEAIVAERRKNGNFLSLADYLVRTGARKDVTEALIKAGAFDEFSASRSGLTMAMDDCSAILKKIKTAKSAYELALSEGDEAKAERAKASLQSHFCAINDVKIDDVDENAMERLLNEKEVAGAFISAHPLDAYRQPEELGCTPINLLSAKDSVSIAGMITGLRITSRKSDGSPLAFFALEDKTGSVAVNCFSKKFAECEQYLQEDAIVKIKGRCIEDDGGNGDNESVLKVIVDCMENVQQNKTPIILSVPSVMDWTNNISKRIRPYLDKDGSPLILYDKMFCRYRQTGLLVNRDILKNDSYNTSI